MRLTKSNVIIGLTGLPGSGKGEFVNCLRGIVTENELEFFYYSLSDVLRMEARNRGLPIERQILHRIGNELRSQFGNGALAKMLLSQISSDAGAIPGKQKVIVIDAIRTPGEVDFFRAQFGKCFYMVAITAPSSVLISRIGLRNRYDEAVDALGSRAGAETLLRKELGEGQPEFGLNIANTIELSDCKIDNSGTLIEFQQKVAELFGRLRRTESQGA